MKKLTYVLSCLIVLFSFILGGYLFAEYKRGASSTFPRDKEVIAKSYDKNKDTSNWKDLAKARGLAREKLAAPYQQLKTIHTIKQAPVAGDWLYSHKENGQSFTHYKQIKPVRKSDKLKTIYVQRIGPFNDDQAKIIALCAEYLELFFNVKVKELKAVDLKSIPKTARRKYPHGNQEQLLTSYLRDKILLKNRPADALAIVGFSSVDLWPGKGWNFVYGQASIRERTGVWSIYRFDNPSESDDAFKSCLRDTIKTASHETVHILSIRHCIAYECLINGCNGPAESTRQPLALCPICVSKVCWNLKADPLKRYKKLAAFCEKNGLKKEADFFKESITILEQQK